MVLGLLQITDQRLFLLFHVLYLILILFGHAQSCQSLPVAPVLGVLQPLSVVVDLLFFHPHLPVVNVSHLLVPPFGEDLLFLVVNLT